MGGWGSVYGEVLQRILAEHKEAAIGVVGCWAKGVNYPVCELDLLIVSNHQPAFERRIEQQLIVDITYVDEQRLFKQSKGLLTLSLSECVILQDPKLLLVSATSSARTQVPSEARALAASALTNAVGYIGLAKRAVKEGHTMSGGFWLLSAGYSLLEALVYSAGDKIRPSHLLSQFRSYASSYSETLYSALHLAEATSSSVKRRLEFLSRVYEAESLGLLDECGLEALLPTLASKKTLYMLESNMVVDAYTYVGYLIIETLRRIYKNWVQQSAKVRLHRFIEDFDDKGVLGKGRLRVIPFPSFDATLIREVEQSTFRLAQSI